MEESEINRETHLSLQTSSLAVRLEAFHLHPTKQNTINDLIKSGTNSHSRTFLEKTKLSFGRPQISFVFF